jgi:hypothetical protein
LRWLESVEEDLKSMAVKNLRCKWQDQEQWRTSLEEAKVQQEEEEEEEEKEEEEEEGGGGGGGGCGGGGGGCKMQFAIYD